MLSSNSDAHYMLLSVAPPTQEANAIRKTIADALAQSFGLASGSAYMDILWVDPDGLQCIVRAHKRYVGAFRID